MTQPDDERTAAAAYAGTALAYAERAVEADDAQVAARALEFVGRAYLAQRPAARPAPPPGVAAPEPVPTALSPELTAVFAAQPRLVARAAGVLGMYAEMDGRDALPWILYARSGYQALLDALTWPRPPLDAFHLRESDEEVHSLVDALAGGGAPSPFEVPPGTPSSHAWWRPRAGG
jgi:hypothetical protein